MKKLFLALFLFVISCSLYVNEPDFYGKPYIPPNDTIKNMTFSEERDRMIDYFMVGMWVNDLDNTFQEPILYIHILPDGELGAYQLTKDRRVINLYSPYYWTAYNGKFTIWNNARTERVSSNSYTMYFVENTAHGQRLQIGNEVWKRICDMHYWIDERSGCPK